MCRVESGAVMYYLGPLCFNDVLSLSTGVSGFLLTFAQLIQRTSPGISSVLTVSARPLAVRVELP